MFYILYIFYIILYYIYLYYIYLYIIFYIIIYITVILKKKCKFLNVILFLSLQTIQSFGRLDLRSKIESRLWRPNLFDLMSVCGRVPASKRIFMNSM
jgi:hypothetical protein